MKGCRNYTRSLQSNPIIQKTHSFPPPISEFPPVSPLCPQNVSSAVSCCFLHIINLSLFTPLEGSLANGALRSLGSQFNGKSINFATHSRSTTRLLCKAFRMTTIMMITPKIQFIQGTDEQTIPDAMLTKYRDGTNGVATFKFLQPSVFDSSSEVGDITGFYMIDEEGVLQSVDVSAKFVNGKPAGIEAKYVMRTPRDWDR